MGICRGGGRARGLYLFGVLRALVQDVEALCLGFDTFVSRVPLLPRLGSVEWLLTCWRNSILWIALFGVFGKLFIKENPEGDGGITRMKHAVWVDLVNALLWLFTAIYGGLMFWKHHTGRSLHTGRATV